MLDHKTLTEDFLEPEFQIGETRFFIRKMRAVEGDGVLTELLHALATTPGDNEVKRENMGDLLRTVFAIDPAYQSKLRDRMFRHVDFANHSAVTSRQLAGAEDMAFEGLLPIHVKEVFLRSLVVNFTDSWRELASRLSLGSPTSSLPDTPTSPPS